MKELLGILTISVAFLILTGCRSNTTEKVTQPDLKQSITETNELAAIKNCRDFVKAQQKYSYMERIDDSSIPNVPKKSVDEQCPEPLGSMLTAAAADQTDKGMASPYKGYLYKVLVAQTEAATDGKNDYTTGGSLTKGFALLAYPFKYGETGSLTFVVSHLGVIYEKDLGAKTLEIAPKVNEYTVDDTWTPVSGN
jgi:hypothetical protein